MTAPYRKRRHLQKVFRIRFVSNSLKVSFDMASLLFLWLLYQRMPDFNHLSGQNAALCEVLFFRLILLKEFGIIASEP